MAVDCGRTTHGTASFLGLVFAKLGRVEIGSSKIHRIYQFLSNLFCASPTPTSCKGPPWQFRFSGHTIILQMQKLCWNMEKWNPNSSTFIWLEGSIWDANLVLTFCNLHPAKQQSWSQGTIELKLHLLNLLLHPRTQGLGWVSTVMIPIDTTGT